MVVLYYYLIYYDYIMVVLLLLGNDRSIVSDVAGTTRDTVDALVERGDVKYRIVDTGE